MNTKQEPITETKGYSILRDFTDQTDRTRKINKTVTLYFQSSLTFEEKKRVHCEYCLSFILDFTPILTSDNIVLLSQIPTHLLCQERYTTKRTEQERAI